MNTAAIIDNLVYLGVGIGFIYFSIKRKDKLGNKITIVRIAGIVSSAMGTIGLILVFIRK